MSRIVPIGKQFTNLRAFLAHIAEDENAVGFVGVIIRDDGHPDGRQLVKTNFGATTAETALASLIIARFAMHLDPEGE